MLEQWYSSYILLGLSLSVGSLVYFAYRDIKRKKEQRRKKSPLRELEEQYLKDNVDNDDNDD